MTVAQINDIARALEMAGSVLGYGLVFVGLVAIAVYLARK